MEWMPFCLTCGEVEEELKAELGNLHSLYNSPVHYKIVTAKQPISTFRRAGRRGFHDVTYNKRFIDLLINSW